MECRFFLSQCSDVLDDRNSQTTNTLLCWRLYLFWEILNKFGEVGRDKIVKCIKFNAAVFVFHDDSCGGGGRIDASYLGRWHGYHRNTVAAASSCAYKSPEVPPKMQRLILYVWASVFLRSSQMMLGHWFSKGGSCMSSSSTWNLLEVHIVHRRQPHWVRHCGTVFCSRSSRWPDEDWSLRSAALGRHCRQQRRGWMTTASGPSLEWRKRHSSAADPGSRAAPITPLPFLWWETSLVVTPTLTRLRYQPAISQQRLCRTAGSFHPRAVFEQAGWDIPCARQRQRIHRERSLVNVKFRSEDPSILHLPALRTIILTLGSVSTHEVSVLYSNYLLEVLF